MPPRFVFWTILIGDQPTAFRAATADELRATLNRLREKHADAQLRWFQRGRLWESREQAQQMLREGYTVGPAGELIPPEVREPRTKSWRPGGEHRDPREKFQLAKKARWQRLKQSLRQGGAPRVDDRERRDGARPPADRSRKPWAPGDSGPRGDGPMSSRPAGGDHSRGPRGPRPPGDDTRGAGGTRTPGSGSGVGRGWGGTRPPGGGRGFGDRPGPGSGRGPDRDSRPGEGRRPRDHHGSGGSNRGFGGARDSGGSGRGFGGNRDSGGGRGPGSDRGPGATWSPGGRRAPDGFRGPGGGGGRGPGGDRKSVV